MSNTGGVPLGVDCGHKTCLVCVILRIWNRLFPSKETLVLSEAGSAAFVDALLNPPAPNDAAKQAVAHMKAHMKTE